MSAVLRAAESAVSAGLRAVGSAAWSAAPSAERVVLSAAESVLLRPLLSVRASHELAMIWSIRDWVLRILLVTSLQNLSTAEASHAVVTSLSDCLASEGFPPFRPSGCCGRARAENLPALASAAPSQQQAASW